MGEHNCPKSFLIKGLDEKKYTDVQFCCPDDDFGSSSVVEAHKTILTLASPVFEKMFTCPTFREHSEEIIEVPDIHAKAFKALIDIIYGKDVQIESNLMAVELWYAAQKYDIIETITEPYLTKQLETVENIIPIYELCVEKGNYKYQEKCIELFENETDNILLDGSFLTCHPTTLLKIFSLNTLFIDSELRLVEAYNIYLEVNKEAKNDIAEALKNIRFFQIDAKDLANITFFTAVDILKIIRIANNEENESEMPLGLSTNREDRCNQISDFDLEVTNVIKKFILGSKHKNNEDNIFRQKFEKVYFKYSHLNLHTYRIDDVKKLVKIYKECRNKN